ncbi:MAG TPA: hypothetical protein VIH91_11950 [Terriglobales bacterium]
MNTTGVLEPDTRPDPDFWAKPEPTALNVLLGGYLVSFTGDQCAVLQVSGQNVLVVQKSKNGLLINAKVFDAAEKIIADIDQNTVTVNPNNSFKRIIKKHSLVVVDQQDNEALNVDFVNAHTVVIHGIFPWPNNGSILVIGPSILANRRYIGENSSTCHDGFSLVFHANGGFGVHP